MTLHMLDLIASLDLVTLAQGRSFWTPEQASTVAGNTDKVLQVINWISYFFFVLIVAVMVYFMFKYRRTEHVAATEGPSHNTPLELTWTIIPLILVSVIFYIGMTGYIDLRQAPADTYDVRVTAQKWSWLFEYPNGASSAEALVVPVDRPVRLIMRSQDVLHSLFVPAFRVKQDVVPGRYTSLWFEATEPGIYDLFCTEYCGTQHSQMVARVEAYPEDEFEVKIEELANWIDDYADDQLHVAGLRLYNRCASCHSLDGSPGTGPSWWETHDIWAQNRVLTDGSEVLVDENYIRDSIINPQKHIVMNYTGAMPTFKGQLKEREIDALVEFVKRLDELVDRQGNPIQ